MNDPLDSSPDHSNKEEEWITSGRGYDNIPKQAMMAKSLSQRLILGGDRKRRASNRTFPTTLFA